MALKAQVYILGVCRKVPQMRHCSLWDGMKVWRSHCCNPVCMNLLHCIPTQSFTILTSDKQHLHQGHNFLPWGTSNKQDAINCLPHQQKCIPQYVRRKRFILMVWFIRCQWGKTNFRGRNKLVADTDSLSLYQTHTHTHLAWTAMLLCYTFRSWLLFIVFTY